MGDGGSPGAGPSRVSRFGGRVFAVARRTARSGRDRLRPPAAADGALRVGVLGPEWLSALLAPSAQLVTSGPADLVVIGPGPDDDAVGRFVREWGWEDVPRVGYRSTAGAALRTVVEVPMVQPKLSNPYRRAIPAGMPDDLVALAGDAVAGGAHQPLPGEALATWLAVERDVAARRRQAWAASVDAVLLGGEPEADVTVVLATNRLHLVEQAVAAVARQTAQPRLVLVTNVDVLDQGAIDRAVSVVPGAVHVHLPASMTLGECLNAGLDGVETRYVAKMDDDDHYDDEHLADQLAVLRATGAGLTGKHSYLAYLETSDRTLLRFPGHEHTASLFVAGGTLLADRSQVGDVRFPARNTGEDTGFRAAVEDSGALIVSSGCLGYVQLRGRENTWRVDDDVFSAKSWVVGNGSPDACFG